MTSGPRAIAIGPVFIRRASSTADVGSCILRRIGEGEVKKEGTIVITLDDLEYSYPDDGDHCCCCGRKWDSHSPWEFFYLDNDLLCKKCAPEYRRARSGSETNQE